ncbi:hypothetical protein THAOC_06207, partial [Thalassiosira oceanica]
VGAKGGLLCAAAARWPDGSLIDCRLKLRGHSGEDAGDGDGEGGRGHGGRGYQSRRGGAPDVGRSVGPSSHRPADRRRRVDGEGRGAVHFVAVSMAKAEVRFILDHASRAEFAVSGGRNKRSGQGEEADTEQWQFHYDDLAHGRIGLGASGGKDWRRLSVPRICDGRGRRDVPLPPPTRRGRGAETEPGSLAMEPRRRRIDDDRADIQKRLCGSRGRERHIAGPDSARGVRRLEEEAEEASSRGRKSGAGEDRGHSS